MLDCRETAVVRNRQEINNQWEDKRAGKVTLKLKPYLETYVVIQLLQASMHLSIRKGRVKGKICTGEFSTKNNQPP